MGTLRLLVLLSVILLPLVTNAQKRKTMYKGFEVSFGTRSFSMTSNIAQLNDLAVTEEGGSAGVIWGNRLLRTKLNAGFYYSGASVGQTVDMFQGKTGVNFYPLAIGNQRTRKFETYLTGGVAYDRYKFAGSYLERDPGKRNYSKPNDSYIGSVNQVSLNGGLGFEYQFNKSYDFVHIFTEAMYGVPVSSKTNRSSFSSTKAAEQLMVSVGVRFGALGK